jgi:hypothetical protein
MYDDGTAETDEEIEGTVRVLNDEVGEAHRLLLDDARSVDTKATVIAGFSAAAVSFLLANRGVRSLAMAPRLH